MTATSTLNEPRRRRRLQRSTIKDPGTLTQGMLRFDVTALHR